MKIKKGKLIAALMLAMFLAAVEGTIVTMATPVIAKDLHGFGLLSLVFSVYLLTSAISTPIYGKFADLFGRKRVLTAGILIFLTGSCFCGLSKNMTMLIAFRALQGLGAGSIFTVPLTIVGDVFPAAERPKVQGSLTTVWGIASLVGPFLGGFLIDVFSWHWIFYINIPFGLLSIYLLQGSLKEHFEKKKHRIDYAGTAVLSVAIILLMSIFLFGQNRAAWLITLLAVIAMALFLAFYWIERRAKEPIVLFTIFTRTSTTVNLISFLVYAVLMGVNVYMPIFFQNVQGYRPTISGLAMLPMSMAWLLATFFLRKLFVKYGRKSVTVGANAAILISSALLLTLGVNSPIVLALVCVFFLGLGFGSICTTLTMIIQDSVDYSKRGTAIAANTLLRTLGQTVGISVFGSIFNLVITRYFIGQGIPGINPTDLYQAASSQNTLSTEQIRYSLNNSIHVLFYVFIVIIGVSLLLSVLLPKMKENRDLSSETPFTEFQDKKETP
jgi:EmrB/QacA subfamily drug resistance transporter